MAHEHMRVARESVCACELCSFVDGVFFVPLSALRAPTGRMASFVCFCVCVCVDQIAFWVACVGNVFNNEFDFNS